MATNQQPHLSRNTFTKIPHLLSGPLLFSPFQADTDPLLPLQAGDLRGISLYQSLDTEGLHTLGTVIVDYRGYRVVGQSIISGILS